MAKAATPARELLPLRIRTLRQAAGLTVERCATVAAVHRSTWEGWERGRSMPRPWNLDAIARAVGAPVASLLVPDGWRALELRLQPGTVERIRAGGRPEAERVAALYAATLADAVLAACRVPARPPHSDGRGKRRRTRAEVLAGIAEAEQMRAAARSRALPEPEAGGGAAREDDGSLYGSHAHHVGAERVSTLPLALLTTAED